MTHKLLVFLVILGNLFSYGSTRLSILQPTSRVKDLNLVPHVRPLELKRTRLIKNSFEIHQWNQIWTSIPSSKLSNYIIQLDPHKELARASLPSSLKLIRTLPSESLIVQGNAIQMNQWVTKNPPLAIHQLNPHWKWNGSFSAKSEPLILELELTQKSQIKPLEKWLIKKNGKILNSWDETPYAIIELPQHQLSELLMRKEVLWLEKHEKIETDTDTIRAATGIQSLQQLHPHLKGQGVVGHVLEGINPSHEAFQARAGLRKKPIAFENGKESEHGHSTFGILFGDGIHRPSAQGFLPDAQGIYTHYDSIYNAQSLFKNQTSRYKLVKDLISRYEIDFQTASWGYASTEEYTIRSAELDQIIFELDLPITQSQGNLGSSVSRPQAWAKNVISVGAVYHQGTLSPFDDVWDGHRSKKASTGPAQDGRIKPDLVGFYDHIFTTTLYGYGPFSGTSAATPAVAGVLGQIIQLWQESFSPFDVNSLNKEKLRLSSRPRASLSKALLIHSASPYPFKGKFHDLNRFHQGWGLPKVQNLLGKNLLVVNETDLLKNQERLRYQLQSNDDPIRITLVYNDPPASPLVKRSLINDLDLRLISPSKRVYWGNYGLLQDNESLNGGEPDSVNNVERIIISQPEKGTWTLEIMARSLRVDSHLETIDLDGDFSLVVEGLRQ